MFVYCKYYECVAINIIKKNLKKGANGEKSLRFGKYRDTCWRDLSDVTCDQAFPSLNTGKVGISQVTVTKQSDKKQTMHKTYNVQVTNERIHSAQVTNERIKHKQHNTIFSTRKYGPFLKVR